MKTIRKNEILTKCGYDWPPEIKGDGPFYAINPYMGCAHNCSYCWAKDLTKRFGKSWGLPDDFEWDKPLVVENTLELLEKELKTKKPGRVLLSSMTDPYQPIERFYLQTRRILKLLLWNDWQPIILTKTQYLRDHALLDYFGNRLLFGVTVTQEDEEARWRLSLAQERKQEGNRTFASLEPWMPWVPALSAQNIISDEAIDFWIIGSLNKAGRAVNPEFYKRELPLLIEWMDKERIRYYIKHELRHAARIEG